MKKFTILVSVVLFLCIRMAAQSIDSTIAKYVSNYAQERTYLQYDKASYIPGETIWFKAYLMEGIAPAIGSKTFYADWTDDKGTLLFHTVSPLVGATTNGQFVIPADYTGKFIHVKAYTKWMLNFDSAFLYEKDIRVLIKNGSTQNVKVAPIASLQFFPEGGDAIADVTNKIAFKANDQWGKPVKIRGIILNSQNIKLDTLKVTHDGMGFFMLTPKGGEKYTVKWKDEKGGDHVTELPAIKESGISLQIALSGNKRLFAINASPEVATALGTVHLIGTMNQYEVFKVSKQFAGGNIQGVIPTQDLPSGILTITVFDQQWKPLAERITYVNNDEYRFRVQMDVTHWGLNKRARNEIEITLPDSLSASLAVSVTDAGIDADSSNNIISHLLLTGDIKGQVYNPYYYFTNTSDTISNALDLVMLTHGWRRFNWEEVAKGKYPKINFPRDTTYMVLSGRVYGATPSQLRESPSIILILSQKKTQTKEPNKMLLLPVEPNGTFSDPSMILFDTAHIYYRVSKGLSDASVTFMENRLPAQRFRMPATGLFYNQVGDTTGNSRHFQLSDEAMRLMQEYEGKVLENVIVKAKTKSPLEVMDEKYSSGLFSAGDSYQFDLVNDKTAFASGTVFTYLQGKVAGLQINTSNGTPSMQWRGGSPQLYLDEVPVDVSLVTSLSVSDIAYIKVFRPPFFGGSGNASGGGIAIYTRRGDDAKSTPGSGLANNSVSGYTPIRQFYAPNYGAYTSANDKRDVRTTLYWNPQVNISPLKNKTTLIFYNNDVSKAFRVIIEGITADGQLAHIEQIME